MKSRLLGILIVIAMLVASAQIAGACTTTLVTRGASVDGSVFVSHSDDGEMGDPRLVYVPAADHAPGALRPVYYDDVSMGERPAFNDDPVRRYVGTDRGLAYVDPSRPQSIALGYIPQVAHTYAYFDANYGIMNEHQLMFGECTDGSKTDCEPEPGKRIFYSAELTRVALERCKTASQAIDLIGHLIETYGYYGTGETLPVADPNEGWVIEMAPSPEGTGGLWVAKKVPDGQVFVAANEFRIRQIDPDDPDMRYASRLHDIAQKQGWWKPADGKLDWLRCVSLGEYNHPYYSLRRVWRVQSLLAPSQKLSPWVKDGYTTAYPFAITPDKKLAPRDVMRLHRDYYQGTAFDQSKGITAGPFGCPYRYDQPAAGSVDTGAPDKRLDGAWERPLSIYRCVYSYVCQGRNWLPDPVGGVLWFGPDEPMSTCYTPFYVGVERIATPYSIGDSAVFSQDSAWWAFNFVSNWAALKYSYMIEDIKRMQDEIERAAINSVAAMDQQAQAAFAKDPARAIELLTDFSENLGNRVVNTWWQFAWRLVARYADGYVNAPGAMAQAVGYSKDWLEKSAWPHGPVAYPQPKSQVAGD